jgi:hypothetical protein
MPHLLLYATLTTVIVLVALIAIQYSKRYDKERKENETGLNYEDSGDEEQNLLIVKQSLMQ